MVARQDLVKLHDWLWEIPASYRSDMQVPARVFASEKMLAEICEDRSLEQLVNVATLPGIEKAAMAMPDVHEGYGFPIGGVAAFRHPDGIISPGGIGYDINCGVRLLRSKETTEAIKPRLAELAHALYRAIPSGVGVSGSLKLDSTELDAVLRDGAGYMIRKGYGVPDDTERLESHGQLGNADPDAVSRAAKDRGHDQLGTIGAGNHFVEIDRVDEIFDTASAQTLGLTEGLSVVLIHTGSRGLGHQVATDYIRTMVRAMPRYGITLADRELACAPFSSPEGTAYFNAMAAAANFAWANRQLVANEVRSAWQSVLGKAGGGLETVYDVAHNIAKVETHDVGGHARPMIVHRKGATRAFGPGHPEVADVYRAIGQPVIIPGSMGTASYILTGTSEGMELSFGSTCHGAGRRMSRHAAKRAISGKELRSELASRGILIATRSIAGLSEEAPLAYKDIHDVVDVVHRAGLARKVAKLKPLVVVKG